jgi:hypothetical protein
MDRGLVQADKSPVRVVSLCMTMQASAKTTAAWSRPGLVRCKSPDGAGGILDGIARGAPLHRTMTDGHGSVVLGRSPLGQIGLLAGSVSGRQPDERSSKARQ